MDLNNIAMDPKAFEGLVNSIKANQDEDQIEADLKASQVEQKQQSSGSKKSPQKHQTEEEVKPKQKRSDTLQMTKHKSCMPAPNTVKTYGKRLYSPLTFHKRSINDIAKEENRPYVIGICGGPSSGKSTVATHIKDKLQLNSTAVILNLMNFYKPIRGNLRRRSRADSLIEDKEKGEEQIEAEIRDVYRNNDFDTPESIDWELLNKGVESLKAGNPFNKPIYDDQTMIRTAVTEHVKPASVIIIEGHLIFCNEELMKHMDLRVFIDTDDDVRLSRRVLKMSRKHPNDMTFLSDLLNKYENYIKPSFEKYIEPTKKYADIILPNYGFSTDDNINVDKMNIPAIDLIIKRLLPEQYN